MSGKALGGCGRRSANGCEAFGVAPAGGCVISRCGGSCCAPGRLHAVSQMTSGKIAISAKGGWGRRIASLG